MITPTIIGIVVAVVSFVGVEIVARRFGSNATFYCMLIAVGGGLLSRLFFNSPADLFYTNGWMLAMAVAVLTGFILRDRRRARAGKKKSN